MALSAMYDQHREDSSRLPQTISEPSCTSHKQTHALLSIKPVHAEAIFSGKKRFEFRRSIFRKDVQVVVVYMTSPVCRVVGEFDVKHVISEDVDKLWKHTESKAGIGGDLFFRYFAGCDVGHAIAIGDVRRYNEPLDLQKTFGVRAPQSFMYLKSGINSPEPRPSASCRPADPQSGNAEGDCPASTRQTRTARPKPASTNGSQPSLPL
jgi:predicted transcriptional regulator